MADEPLTLRPGSWYAWHMFPGYGTPCVPYVSQIRVDAVVLEKTGQSTMRIAFWNSGYAIGVQSFELRLRILARRPHHLVAELLYGSGGPLDRHAVIGRIGREWLQQYVRVPDGVPFPTDDPISQAQVDDFLERVERRSGYGMG